MREKNYNSNVLVIKVNTDAKPMPTQKNKVK